MCLSGLPALDTHVSLVIAHSHVAVRLSRPRLDFLDIYCYNKSYIPPGTWMFVVSVVCCQVEVSATD